MRVFSIAKGIHKIVKDIPPELTQKETDRLRAIRLYGETEDVNLVCKTFQISRSTFYRRLKRFDPKDLASLKDMSRRPKRLRKPKWQYELIMAVKELRRQYPMWGKDKLVVLLKDKGIETSASTAGRIIKYLKKRGDIIEPKRKGISAKRRMQRPYAIRKPKDYMPTRSPKLNGCVERANRTHTEEFYEVYDCPWTVSELNEQLIRWEHTYNCIRPRQSLGQKTPLQFLKGSGIINTNYPSALSHMW